MRNNRYRLKSAAMAVALAVSLSGCGGSGSSETTAASGSSGETAAAETESIAAQESVAAIEESGGEVKEEMHIAYSPQPPTLDLHTTSTTAARTLGCGVFEKLVSVNGSYEWVPELAESVDVSDDYTQYTFHLRQGVKFHNGKEMTADDVVASMNRWIGYYGIAGKTCGDSRFEKTDDYTVSITLPSSYMNFLDMIGAAKQPAAIMPSEVIEAAGDGTVTEFIGTGPYKVDEWSQDQYVKLVKFDDYTPYGTKGEASGWSGYKEALTNTVYFDFVLDAATRATGIQTGEYDLVESPPNDNYEMLKANEDLQMLVYPGGGLNAVFDKSGGWTADANFRKAVNAALDKETCAMAAYGLTDFFRLDPGYMFQEQTRWYTDAGKENYMVNDQEKAKEYLEACGYDGSEITLLCSSSYPAFNNLGIAMEQQLEAVGINVNLLVVDWPTQQSYLKDPEKYDIFITSLTPCAAPTDTLYLQTTWSGFSDDEKLQDYMSRIGASTDQDEAYQIWCEAQEYCWDEYLPVSKICDIFQYAAASKKVAGLTYFQGPVYYNTVVYK